MVVRSKPCVNSSLLHYLPRGRENVPKNAKVGVFSGNHANTGDLAVAINEVKAA